MSSAHLERVEEIFQAALDLPPEQRAAYLGDVCGGDAELRSEVEALLISYEDSGDFIERPAMEIDAAVVARSLGGAPIGQTFSHYHIIERLGEGGMGEVYLAQDTTLGRRIALKILPARFTIDADRVHRFEQEARSASALNHPNIVTIHEVGEAGSAHFIATEFIEGVTLRDRLSSRRMNLSEVLDAATQIASALAAAHTAGIVHRDIKPENIMLRSDGYVKLLDFGLAKLTDSETKTVALETRTKAPLKTDPGMIMGTVNYMSPEQARGLPVDARTDIWSLGIVLYEMLAGRTPFEGETPSHSLVATLDREAPPLSNFTAGVPPSMERIVAKSLNKNRNERYRTATELLADFQKLKQELEAKDGRDASLPLIDLGTKGPDTKVNRSPMRTDLLDMGQRPSSAGYLFGAIMRERRRLVVGLSTGVAIVLTLIALSYVWSWRKAPQAAAAVKIKSIAVLPFSSTNAATADDNLGFGMADTLITRLSNLRELRVSPTSAVRKYASPNRDPLAAGRELKVDAVLDSTIQRANNRIRVTLRLVNTADGTTLWSDQDDEQIDDVFAVQDRITERVARALLPQLTGSQKTALTKRYTQNTEAYRLYMNGRYHWSRHNAEDLEKSIAYFNQAIEKDPNYAPAYAGLADIYTGIVVDGRPKEETIPKARQAITTALALDETLPEAHVSAARLKAYYEWDWSGAEREFRRAIELDPNAAFAHGEYGSWLAGMGRSDEAISETKLALDLDPLSLGQNFYFVWALLSAHRYDDVIAHARQVMPTFPQAHYWMGMGYLRKGMNAEAIGEFEKRITLEPKNDPVTRASLGYAYGITGRKSEAEKILAELKDLYEQRKTSAYTVANIYSGLGDKDRAMAWLEKAYQEHSRSLWGLKVNPGWDSLRSDPRFTNLLQRLKLE